MSNGTQNPVDAGQRKLNDAWSLVTHQWTVAVQQRWQQLQQLVDAFGGLGR